MRKQLPTHSPHAARRRSQRLWLFKRCVRGAAAVEFAMIAPVIVFIMIGVVDFGLLMLKSMQVSSANRAGVQFILVDPEDYSTNIATVIQNATNLPPADVSVSTSESCRCLGSASAVDCLTGSCSGSSPPKFVTITTTYSHDLVMGYPGIPNPWVVTRSTVVRIPSE